MPTGHWMSTGSHNQFQLKHSFLKAKTYKHFKAVLPHSPHKSSPHFLCGRGSNTSSKPHPLQTIVTTRQLPSGRTVPSITPAYSASLSDMASPLTSCHAPKPPGGVQRSHRIRDTPTYSRRPVDVLRPNV